MQDATIGLLHAAYAVTGIPRQFIPMHKGAGGFMSNEQFGRFYWPTFKALIEECVAAGITPMPLFEGDYTPRLEFLAELPPGKVAAHFDRVDRKKFKEVCGDVLCFWGNVPSSLLVTGTPQQVKDDVKELIDLFGEIRAHPRRPGRHTRPGQAGERRGARRGGRGVRQPLSFGFLSRLDTQSLKYLYICGTSAPGPDVERNLQGGEP